jgi:hypothetical protein
MDMRVLAVLAPFAADTAVYTVKTAAAMHKAEYPGIQVVRRLLPHCASSAHISHPLPVHLWEEWSMIKTAEQNSTDTKTNTAAIAAILFFIFFILHAPFLNLRMNFIFIFLIISYFQSLSRRREIFSLHFHKGTEQVTA